MVQEMARKTANKMADQAVIDPQKIHIYYIFLMFWKLFRLFYIHRILPYHLLITQVQRL